MNKPRVLIGTPLYDKPELCYAQGLIDVLKLRDADYDLMVIRGCYVNVARNDIVHAAKLKGFGPDDEIIFADADLDFTSEHISRLRSHDVEIVGAIYAKRLPGKPQWTCHATGEPQIGTLLPVNDVATGLLRIKMSVFQRIEAINPDRRYVTKGTEGVKCEFFPIGLIGDGTPEARIEAIRRVLRESDEKRHPEAILEQIKAVLGKESPPSSRDLFGEDTSFCRLARQAGVKLYADTSCVLRHQGSIMFPAEEIAI